MSITVWCWGQHEGDSPEERRRATEKHVLTEAQATRLLEWMSAEDWEDGPRCVLEIVEDPRIGHPEGHPEHDLVNLFVRFADESGTGQTKVTRPAAKLALEEMWSGDYADIEWHPLAWEPGQEVARVTHLGNPVAHAWITPARKP